ncbi:hypothetical protein [Kitasatospora sp. NPDC101183]|uniref:hypothetical protein n=1 Tax=Kitasatospora sp. NPDC101183 TaxID=3364100 RepID=UPI00382E0B44
MRAPAPPRPTRRRLRRDGLTVGLAAAGLALAATTTGLAAAAPDPVPFADLVLNGGFDSYPWIWACDANVSPSSIPHDHYVTGHPGEDGTAGCRQTVKVLPNSTYTLDATVRGPFAFTGVTGAGGENASTWSSGTTWHNQSVQVTTGPRTTELTVYFHGWYEQAAYDVHRVSFIGPGFEPSPCGETATATASPSPSPSCQRTYIP